MIFSLQFDEKMKEIRKDIIKHTYKGYAIDDLVLMNAMLVYDVEHLVSDYYTERLSLNESAMLRWATIEVINRVTYSIANGNWKDIDWLDIFDKQIEWYKAHNDC